MSAPPKKTAAATGDLVDVLIERFAAALVARLQPTAELYYDARTVPPEIGAHLFLKAAQAKEFPSFVVGNRVVARRADVHAWVESRPFETKAKSKDGAKKGRKKATRADDDADDLALQKAGLVQGDKARGS